jgi:DNA-binding NarL/FixJ family response regulator
MYLVLLAEDESGVANEIRTVIEKVHDVRVIWATSKEEALLAMETHYIDAAIVDIELKVPGAGLDVLDHLGECSPTVPVVIATKLLGGRQSRLLAPLASLARILQQGV